MRAPVGETITIADRAGIDKLVPVVTSVYGIARPKAMGAWLSYLSICRRDCAADVRLETMLSPEIESRCESHLDRAIEQYVKIESMPQPVLGEMARTIVSVLKSLSSRSRAFLRGRCAEICGAGALAGYWDVAERAGTSEELSNQLHAGRGAMELRKLGDFYEFVFALAMLYGSTERFRSRLVFLSDQLKNKYAADFPFGRLGLYLWPIDFSFVENEEDSGAAPDENLAILSAVSSINPGVRVQVCAESQLWARDILAWLDDDFSCFVKPDEAGPQARYGRGALSEGGNIITGKARDRFVLVAQGPLSSISAEIDFYNDLFFRDIRPYTLPDGFLWARHPATGEDMALDSVHIDTVINVVPAACTLDNLPKVLVDPFYLTAVRENPEFVRFLNEQDIRSDDVIEVDKSELFLNLPNFSVLLMPAGEPRLLFNKDRGLTLPRLNLRPGTLVQPGIEITAMAAMFGCIRCATNMLPQSYFKDGSEVSSVVAHECSPEAGTAVRGFLKPGAPLTLALSKQFVKRVEVRTAATAREWEFDDFSRTAYVYVRPDEAGSAEKCMQAVRDHGFDIAKALSERQGIGM